MYPDNLTIYEDGTVIAEIDGVIIEFEDLDAYYDYIS